MVDYDPVLGDTGEVHEFVGELQLREGHPMPNTITFNCDGDGGGGTLYLDPPMRFEGDTEESANVFFDCVILQYNNHVHQQTNYVRKLEAFADRVCAGDVGNQLLFEKIVGNKPVTGDN